MVCRIRTAMLRRCRKIACSLGKLVVISVYRKFSNKRPRRLLEHGAKTPRHLLETRRLWHVRPTMCKISSAFSHRSYFFIVAYFCQYVDDRKYNIPGITLSLLINVITVAIVLHSIAFLCSLCSDFVWNKRYKGY